MVQPHLQIYRAAIVLAMHVGGDLDADDLLAVDGLGLGRRAEVHLANDRRVLLGQGLELGRVVLVDAVALTAGRQGRGPRRDQRTPLGPSLRRVAGHQVLDQRVLEKPAEDSSARWADP